MLEAPPEERITHTEVPHRLPIRRRPARNGHLDPHLRLLAATSRADRGQLHGRAVGQLPCLLRVDPRALDRCEDRARVLGYEPALQHSFRFRVERPRLLGQTEERERGDRGEKDRLPAGQPESLQCAHRFLTWALETAQAYLSTKRVGGPREFAALSVRALMPQKLVGPRSQSP